MKRILGIALLILSLTGCAPAEEKPLAIADQYGMGYAPLEVMKHEGYLEKHLGVAVPVKWVKLGNTTAIRESMLSGNLDVGFMAIPPFLIGVDTGMPWKIFTGLSSSPLGLITRDPEIISLEDLADKGKIALPQPGSIQHILLAMAAQREIGDPNVFDNQLIAMKHPDGMQALLSGTEVAAHFTAPPYLQQELAEPGVRQLLSGEEAFGGPFTFIVGVAQPDFLENEERRLALQAALEDALNFMAENPDETAALLAEAYEMEPEAVREQIYHQGLAYQTQIEGIEGFAVFMTEAGYLSQTPETQDILWQE